MKLIKILSFDNQQEAHLVMGRLQNEGIDCFLQNENFGTLMPHYSTILGSGIDLMIKETDEEKVKKLLNDYFAPSVNVCPNCGSNNIMTGIGNNKYSKWILVLISLTAAMPFGNIKSKKFCQDCKLEY